MSGDGGFSAPWGSPGPDGGTAGGADGPALTDTDRGAAVAALDVHRAAGRLDDVGFEERTVRARRAATRADLDLLFLDLPEPHAVTGATPWGSAASPSPLPPPPPAPVYGSPSAGSSAPPPLPPGAPQYAPGQYPQPRRPLLPPETARKVLRLAPFLAFALLWFTRQWIFFLIIPVVAVVLGDAGRGGRRRRR